MATNEVKVQSVNNVGCDKDRDQRQVRVWMDGSFDLLHAGHVAAMQQARSLGHHLVVGAQPDADVLTHKGPPVFPEQERFRLIEAVKFVDEFAGAASYGTTVETLDRHACDFCVHGDDAPLRASDTDAVKVLMKKNRAKLVTRGFGPSTTLQIQRVLQRSEADEQRQRDKTVTNELQDDIEKIKLMGSSPPLCPPEEIRYQPTASQISAFLNGRARQADEKVVYVDGAFDLFNIGHLIFLEKAAQEGSFLLVGVHTDRTVRKKKGPIFPVLCMLERALIVLSMKCVSDVILNAPDSISKDFLEHFKIDVVCRGALSSQNGSDEPDPYAVPKQLGIYKEIDSGCDVTSATVVDRILSRRETYSARNERKLQLEIDAAEKLKTRKSSKAE